MTLNKARRVFFDQNDFGPDGGYDDAWATAAFGPLTYTVPNGRLRADALRLHDLHHVATGYATDWQGEAQISAWELGGGLSNQPYAWLIGLWGVFPGLLFLPSRTLAAFARGRRSKTLYGTEFQQSWLRRDVAWLRARLQVVDAVKPRVEDGLVLAGWAIPALAVGTLALPVAALLALLGAVQQHMPKCGAVTA